MGRVYCYNKKGEKTLSAEKWISLIKEFKKMKGLIIDILCGEPFHHKDFYRILPFASKESLSIIFQWRLRQ